MVDLVRKRWSGILCVCVCDVHRHRCMHTDTHMCVGLCMCVFPKHTAAQEQEKDGRWWCELGLQSGLADSEDVCQYTHGTECGTRGWTGWSWRSLGDSWEDSVLHWIWRNGRGSRCPLILGKEAWSFSTEDKAGVASQTLESECWDSHGLPS